ncbi:hypothetical protein EHS39_28260 [Ensifer sp. MPMI2T]|nr:hypothetical protein EHS39_28260 [Ensifer sp. MPMI2T]
MNFRRIIAELLEAFCKIWQKLVEMFLRWRAARRLPERARRATPATCVPIREPAFHRPDPLLYSQYDLMRRGFAVTWNNPDIEVLKGGSAVSTSDLEPSTEYDVVARIWNNSGDAPVVGLPVRFSYLTFGIGIESRSIGSTAVNLGVKGGPNHPAFATMKWRTPAEPGHYCLQVLLEPVDDTNFGNNLGQENVVVGHPQSPVIVTFELRNARATEQTFRFDFDTYRIPSLPACADRPTSIPERNAPATMIEGRPVRPVPAAHDRRNYPLPADWTVTVEPAESRLAPGEQLTIRVVVTAPDGFAGEQPININAFDDIGFAGGVTLQIRSP